MLGWLAEKEKWKEHTVCFFNKTRQQAFDNWRKKGEVHLIGLAILAVFKSSCSNFSDLSSYINYGITEKRVTTGQLASLIHVDPSLGQLIVKWRYSGWQTNPRTRDR